MRAPEKYLIIEECEHGRLYKIKSRNLSLGVYDENAKGFIGIRTKFGSRFLFTEYHYDTGAPFGTAWPIEALDLVPSEIKIEERGPTIDQTTGREVAWTKESKWFFKDNNKSSDKIRPTSIENKPLFDWLDEKAKINN